jgi:hypothetical protein
VALGVAVWLDDREPDTDAPLSGETTSPTAAARTTARPSSTTTIPISTTTSVDPGSVVPTDRFVTAPGASAVAGTGPLRTYAVEVEQGIPIDPSAFAASVDATLADRRGWTAPGGLSLRRVGPGGSPGFRVRLATPATVDAHCAPLQTNGVYSCRQGADVMINAVRWFEGAAESHLSLADYRHYVISHEVGHALGHGHVGCPSPGAVAPVMMQQTKGLAGCTPNPWPYP